MIHPMVIIAEMQGEIQNTLWKRQEATGKMFLAPLRRVVRRNKDFKFKRLIPSLKHSAHSVAVWF